MPYAARQAGWPPQQAAFRRRKENSISAVRSRFRSWSRTGRGARLVLVEREVAELCSAAFRFNDGVVLILSAMPVADAERLVLVIEFCVGLLRVPRLDQGRRVVDPHID